MFDSVSATTTWSRVLQATTVVETPDSQSIGSVVGTPSWLGALCLLFSMVCLSCAIHYDCIEQLAPRAANRPKSVMKNAILHGISDKFKNKIYVYPFAWIYWAFKLTYKQCLSGIPGTGTRKDGWEGPLLKVNLDGVIWLKFHTLLFKISLVVAVLCTLVLLPVNMTAKCDPEIFGRGTCAQHYNQSQFVQTTIAHIPDKVYNDDPNTTLGISLDAANIVNSILRKQNSTTKVTLGDIEFNDDNTTSDSDGEEVKDEEEDDDEVVVAKESINKANDDWNEKNTDLATSVWIQDQTWRIQATCVCCVIIYVYTMYLVWHEWIENVALRRAFFLEASHYGQRMIELNKLDLDFCKKMKSNDNTNSKREESYPPYLTHPEIRETPPSVGLYSVLYQLPNSMVTYDTDGATSVERQLVATTKFFDMVVPPQPGFSSSVIAVTVIPKAKLVAKAWMKWNNVEVRLQKLRHIRRLIAKAEAETKNKKDSSVDSKEDEDEIVFESTDGKEENGTKRDSVKVVSDFADGDVETLRVGTNDEADDELDSPQSEVFKYEDFDVKVYARSLGFSDEVDKVSDFVNGMGIEEFNVFAYNCALMEGGPGIGKKVINLYDVEKLRKTEKEVLEELDDCHQELINARSDVTFLDDDETVALKENNPDTIPAVESMRSATSCDEWRVTEEEFSERLELMFSESKNSKRKKVEGTFSSIKDFCNRVWIGPETSEFDPKYYGFEKDREGTVFKTDIDHPAYAVITFASRHSAIVARQCLADGVAANNWIHVDELPIYPLADAPENMWTFPRGFMRPVTPTISYTSKKLRKWAVFIFLVFFIGSFTAILNQINKSLWDPELYEGLFGLDDETVARIIPTLSGLTQTLLFIVCPQIFKIVSFKSGVATSFESSEQRAMIYFWYFYLVVRYLGQLVVESFEKFTAGMAESGKQVSVEQIVVEALSQLSRTTPTILGPAALTFIIFSATLSWPIAYFLQVNNFLTSWFRLDWINRMLKGGGPGPEMPYRIYVDIGYVFSCVTTLAPVCPLIGPFALLYFIILAPMIRWMAVFAYRPKFDSGGDKWPKLYHIIITSLLIGQVLTMLTFFLKGNFIAGVVIGCCIIPTFLFNSIVLEKFLRPFRDASLHFTGKIHKYQNEAEEEEDPWQEREEFRRWLVDCHKASYLPTCMSGGDKSHLTAEPAVVTPKVNRRVDESAADHYNIDKDMRNLFTRQSGQKGGIMRRQRFGI